MKIPLNDVIAFSIKLVSKSYFLLRYSYCAFHKHANSKVQKPPSQLRFSLPSIIIAITSNEPWNTETHKRDRNPPITNHKPWPFVLFPKRSVKMIDGSEKRNRHSSFELRNSHVCEKHSKPLALVLLWKMQDVWVLKSDFFNVLVTWLTTYGVTH